MSTISAGTTSTTTLIHSGDTTGSLVFKTNDTGSGGTTAVTIDTSQNVGIGTSSPSYKLEVNKGSAGQVASFTGGTGVFQIYSGTGSVSAGDSGQNNGIGFNTTSGYINFVTSNGSERMRIDSSGNMLIGTSTINTISPRLTILGQTAGKQWSCGPTSGNDNFFVYNQASAGVYISYGSTSWTASSDERRKDIIEPITDAAEKVSTLRAVIGKYKTDEEGTRRSFLIAQDVQKVLPEAVDAGDSENLGVSYTDVVPLLVAAVKELKVLVDTQASTIQTLKDRITALEAK